MPTTQSLPSAEKKKAAASQSLLGRIPRWVRWPLMVLLGGFGIIVLINLWVIGLSHPYVYEDLESLPENDVAIVLGTSPKMTNGRPNIYFVQRMDAAAALYKAGKVKHLIVSGDNRTKYYNEPRYMRIALEKRGVPRQAITLDFAGFRTLDSMVRAKLVFGQESMTVVTNDFHVNRAVFIGRERGEDVVGYGAGDVGGLNGLRNHAREFASRVMAFLDVYFLDTKPRHDGPEEPLKLPSQETAKANQALDLEAI